MKKCPFCAEEIQSEAVVCRFCHLDLRTGKPIQIKENTKSSQKKAGITVQDGVNLGLGLIKLYLIICLVGLGVVVVFLILFSG